MKRLTLFAAVLAVASACGMGPENEFRNGVPNQDTTKVNVPQSTGQGLESTRQGLQGQTASFYQFTAGVSAFVNGATVAILDMVKNITDNPATSVSANQAVWGPWTDPLSANTIKLTVTKTADHTYSYELDGKAKSQPDSAFVALLTGSHVATVDSGDHNVPGFGSGSFTVNWDNVHTLPQNDGNVGVGEFEYSRVSPTAQVTVNVNVQNVRDRQSGQLISAKYAYAATPGQGGTFQFSELKDFIAGPNGNEDLAVESRWLETGAGRSDVKTTGGDAPAGATVSECWDTQFASQFLTASWDPSIGYGQESVCAFTPAVYSTL